MMICSGTSDRWCGFDHVQAIHFMAYAVGLSKLVQLPPPVKLFHVADVAGSTCKEIRIEREYDFGLFRVIHSIDLAAEGQFRSIACSVVRRRLPLMPLRLRHAL